MTAYDDLEASVDDGSPLWLYQFARGSEDPTYFAASRRNVTFDGIEWTKSPIAHSVIEQNGAVERSEVKVTFPLDDVFAFGMLVPQYLVTSLTIFRGHYTDAGEERRQYWKGRVVGVESNPASIVMSTENLYSSLRRSGCRVRVQKPCRHDLYGIGCTLDKDDFAHAMTCTSSSANVIIVTEGSTLPGKLSFGMVEWNGIFGMIEYQSYANPDALRLAIKLQGLSEAIDLSGPQAVTVYEGCNRSWERCVALGNHLNYGGFRWMPQQNAFDGSLT